MKKFLVTFFSVVLAAILCVSMFVGCDRNMGSDDNNQIDGEVDTTQAITLYIESAAPLKYNYKALLKSEEEGSQVYKQAQFTKVVVEGFKELYPNITLRFVEDGWGDALWQRQQLYIREYQNGTTPTPDILIGESYMGYLAQNGVFSALDSSKFTHVIESSYADMKIGDNLYGVPMASGLMGLQYNATILQEAGIPETDWEPETWADLLENCKKVSEYAASNNKSYSGIVMNNVKGMSSAYRALPFMRAAGGDYLDDNGDFDLDSTENIAAFTYLRELAQYAYGPSLTESSEDTVQYMFNQGKGAYFVEGQWSMISAGENIRACELPKSNNGGTGNCYVGSMLFGVAKWSKNKVAAQAFLEYITSETVQQALYKYDGRLPVNKTYLNSDEIRLVQPNMNGYIDAMIAGGFGGGLPSITQNTTSIWEKWGNFYSSVLTTKTDISTLAQSTNKEINDLM